MVDNVDFSDIIHMVSTPPQLRRTDAVFRRSNVHVEEDVHEEENEDVRSPHARNLIVPHPLPDYGCRGNPTLLLFVRSTFQKRHIEE